MESTLMSYGEKLSREQLALVPTPQGTLTHRPIPHGDVVNALVETLGFRHIGIVKDEYAVSRDGMKMFGVMDLEAGIVGIRFSIGIRNAHDKSMRLAMIVGYRVVVCENMNFHGDYEPVLAKHTKNFSLVDAISIGIDRMQRNFAPMTQQVELWRGSQITDESAKIVIYRAFVEGELEAPKHLAGDVHNFYFSPQHEEFAPRTRWSLSNAFTSAFKSLDPIPQFRATANLAGFLNSAF